MLPNISKLTPTQRRGLEWWLRGRVAGSWVLRTLGLMEFYGMIERPAGPSGMVSWSPNHPGVMARPGAAWPVLYTVRLDPARPGDDKTVRYAIRGSYYDHSQDYITKGSQPRRADEQTKRRKP